MARNEFIKSVQHFYQVVCAATWDSMPYGCYDAGPRAESGIEAREKAKETGWIEEDFCWICPGHQMAKIATGKS